VNVVMLVQSPVAELHEPELVDSSHHVGIDPAFQESMHFNMQEELFRRGAARRQAGGCGRAEHQRGAQDMDDFLVLAPSEMAAPRDSAQWQKIHRQTEAILCDARQRRQWVPARQFAGFTRLCLSAHMAVPPAGKLREACFLLSTKRGMGSTMKLAGRAWADVERWMCRLADRRGNRSKNWHKGEAPSRLCPLCMRGSAEPTWQHGEARNPRGSTEKRGTHVAARRSAEPTWQHGEARNPRGADAPRILAPATPPAAELQRHRASGAAHRKRGKRAWCSRCNNLQQRAARVMDETREHSSSHGNVMANEVNDLGAAGAETP
ncbi:hypothetical protein CYMTET_33088, partial [Cymbomonas tetramitiformis]